MDNKIKKIFVVFKTHFDIGFTALPSEIKKKYTEEMVPKAVDTCIESKLRDPNHPYVWTMPSWPLTYVLKEKCEGLENLIHQKQIVWHGLPFTTHTEFCGLEEFIRGMYISKKLAQKFGYQPISAKMTDVPGHTWILPSLLSKVGIKFLHLGCNPCSTPPDVPALFYWEGPDGSRVLTYYSKGDYGSGVFPPEEWELPIWLAMMSTGDNHGAHNSEVIRTILEEVAEKSPETEVYFGTLDDFYEELSKIDLDIPVIKKDFADSWIHGVGSYPREVSEVRELRTKLLSLEALLAFKKMSNDGNNLQTQELIQNAYENLLLFGEHTWGMDTKLALNPEEFGGRVYGKKEFKAIQKLGKFDRIQKSWKEKSEYVEKAATALEKAQRCFQGRYNETTENYIKVYNTIGFQRGGLVEVKEVFSQDFSILDMETNEILNLIPFDGKIYFKVKRLEAFSYKIFKIINKTKDIDKKLEIAYETATTLNLENDNVIISVDKNSGSILSLRNKKTDKEWVDSKAEHGFGQYIYDVYSKREVFEYVRDYAYDLQDWYLADFGKPGYPTNMKHRAFKHDFQSACLENSPNFGRIVIQYGIYGESIEDYGNTRSITLTITLWDKREDVDFEYNIKQKQETPCPESGHFVFPLCIDSPTYSINKVGSVIDPTKDIIKDANHVLYCCEKWVDISDDKEGMLFIPYDTPLLSIGKQGIERYSKDYTPSCPTVFFNAFNNQWGTNFPQWIGGDFTFRYKLLPHTGNWKDVNAPKRANEALVAFATSYTTEETSVGTHSDNRIILNDLDTVEVVVIKCAEDGNGIILRLRETHGRESKQSFVFNKNVHTVFVCDLLEDILEKKQFTLVSEGKEVQLRFHPFEIITLRIIF